jgi:hypothetical protein
MLDLETGAGQMIADLPKVPQLTVYFLRLVVWIVPNFTVEKYREELFALH